MHGLSEKLKKTITLVHVGVVCILNKYQYDIGIIKFINTNYESFMPTLSLCIDLSHTHTNTNTLNPYDINFESSQQILQNSQPCVPS